MADTASAFGTAIPYEGDITLYGQPGQGGEHMFMPANAVNLDVGSQLEKPAPAPTPTAFLPGYFGRGRNNLAARQFWQGAFSDAGLSYNPFQPANPFQSALGARYDPQMTLGSALQLMGYS